MIVPLKRRMSNNGRPELQKERHSQSQGEDPLVLVLLRRNFRQHVEAQLVEIENVLVVEVANELVQMSVLAVSGAYLVPQIENIWSLS